MVFHWIPPLIATSLVLQTAALASAPSAEHLAGGRTVLRNDALIGATAEVSGLGEVALHTHQVPVINGFSDRLSVFGGFLLVTVNPGFFAGSTAVKTALIEAITYVAAWPGVEPADPRLREAARLSVSKVAASVNVVESIDIAVRIDFQIAYVDPKHRQTFIKNTVEDNAQKLAETINTRVPSPYKGYCKLLDAVPEESLLEYKAAAEVTPQHKCFGRVSLDGLKNPSPSVVARSTEWQEAVAMVISQKALVSRVQVGLVMAVQSSSSVSVDYWITGSSAMLCQAVIQRVDKEKQAIFSDASGGMASWALSKGITTGFFTYGRIVVEVPNPQDFAASRVAEKAVNRAALAVATNPGPEETKLSVQDTNVKLAAYGTRTAQVMFLAAFETLRDRQVFIWDVALDGGHKLAKAMNEEVKEPYKGNCWLPGQRNVQAVQLPNPNLDAPFVIFRLYVSSHQDVARDGDVREAMALAISRIASVPAMQVGLLLKPATSTKVKVTFWVTSADMAYRQVALQKVKQLRQEFFRQTLVQLDKLEIRAESTHLTKLSYGSLALLVPDAQGFSTSDKVRKAVRKAIRDVTGVSSEQVQSIDVVSGVWKDSPKVVRVDFRVALTGMAAVQAFARAIVVDGAKNLARSIRDEIPVKCSDGCRLPDGSNIRALDMNLRPVRGQPHGTMLLNVFNPELFVQDVGIREAVASAIAYVASVSRLQVGTLMSVESAGLVRVDFVVFSNNAGLQQAAVAQVEKQWRNHHLGSVRNGTLTYKGPAFTACGGTLSCCPSAGSPYACS